ncbi:Elongator complex protein 1 [Venturia nashicola]|nr:Elongator complex protein 1 [Venturia nashicola]
MDMPINGTTLDTGAYVSQNFTGAYSLLCVFAIGAIVLSVGNTKWSALVTGIALPGIPRVRGNPLLGLLPYSCYNGLAPTLNLLYEASEKQGLSYGWMGSKVLVLLRNEGMIRFILSRPDEIVSRTGGQRLMAPFSTLQRLLGNVLFLYVGEEATMMRNAMKAEYKHVSALQAMYSEVVRTVQDHVQLLKRHQEKGQDTENLLKLTSDFSADVLSRIYFGLEGTHTRDDGLEHIADRMLEISASASHALRHGLHSIFTLRSPRRQDEEEKIIWESLDAISEQRLRDMYQSEEKNTSIPPVAQSISLATGGGFSRTTLSTYAIEQGRLTLFGGRFGIGIVLTWALIELSKHPSVLSKLKYELNNLNRNGDEFPNFQSLATQTPYLDAVIHEIHRLFPPVHATARIINSPISLKTENGTPVHLEKGMIIYISIYHLHREKAIWGENANTFVPERFLSGSHKRSGYMPFLYGRRACVGREFSLLVEKTFLVGFLRCWDFDVRDKDVIRPKFTALCLPDREVEIGLRESGKGDGEV